MPTRTFFITHLCHFFNDDIGSQSMHAGGAMSLAENWVTPHIIQGIGHWALSTWQIYLHKHPVLLQAMLHAWLCRPYSSHVMMHLHWGIHPCLGSIFPFFLFCSQLTASSNVFVSWCTMLLGFNLFLLFLVYAHLQSQCIYIWVHHYCCYCCICILAPHITNSSSNFSFKPLLPYFLVLIGLMCTSRPK